MFTGIIEHRGRVARVAKRGGGARLEIHAPEIVDELAPGDSVAVNGACVTVTERNTTSFACDLVPETVSRTTLGILQVDEEVNLERPMRMSDRFGGHIVQGHVDAVGVVRSRRRVGAQEVMEITIPFELSRYFAPQGSVALDGVSLTVVAVEKDRFRVALIPYTVEMTILGSKVQGSSVNVEIDVLSKYVERHMLARMTKPNYLATPGPSPAETPPTPATVAPAAAKAAAKPAPRVRAKAKAPASRTRSTKKTAKRPTAPAKKKKAAVAKRPSRSATKRGTGSRAKAKRTTTRTKKRR